MRVLLAILLFTATLQKQFKLNYNHTSNTIQLYDEKSKPINLKIAFDTPDLQLHQSLKGTTLFLQKNSKHKLEKMTLAKYEYKLRPGAVQDEALGIVGLQDSNTFSEILRRTLDVSEVKLQVKRKESLIYIIDEPCKYPLFAPLPITLSEVSTHTYNINAFSTEFHPDISFLKLIGKNKNPFEMSSAEMNEEITVSIRDRIISVPFKDIVTCGKYQNSDLFECQLTIKDNADVGGMLLYFDPIFCNSGVELHREIDDSWGFHYSHLILLVLQFILLVFLVKDEKVVGFLSNIINGRKDN